MKQNNFMRKTLLLLALVAGVSSAWATGADPYSGSNASNKAPIPGTIALDYGTYTGYNTGKTDNPISSGHTDWMQANSTATFNLSNSTAQKYVFIIEAVTANSSASLEVKIYSSGKEASPESGTKSISIPNNGTNWERYDTYCFVTENNLPATDLTLKITFKDAGSNIKNIALRAVDSFSDPLPVKGSGGSDTYLDFSKGNLTTTSTPRYGESSDNNKISYVKKNTGADGFFVNITSDEDAYYNMHVNIPWYSKGGTLKVTVTDVETGNDEIDGETVNVTGTGDIVMKLSSSISGGIKKIKFEFINDEAEKDDYLFNIKNVTFYKRSLNEGYDYTPVAATGVDVVLTRTINAGNWSTIVLPFAMTSDQITSTFGTNVKLAQFKAYDSENKTVTMSEATTMKANEPYMIKVAESEYTSPVTIEGVTIVEPADAAARAKTCAPVTFQGVYEKGTITSGDYYVKNNNLYKATGTQSIKPFRAYFTGVPSEARLLFLDDDATTISEIAKSQEPTANGQYYDLQGRKVAQPTKGLYIVNGRKVVIR